jgi:2-phospho-L-lactate guanylyltransferase
VPVIAVIPVKSFRLGKQRLSSVLPEEQRRDIGARLAEHTVETAEAAGLVPVIVAGDPEVAEWALRGGIPVVEDPGIGLDGAARAGAEWADTGGNTWLVLHADLPLLDVADLEVLCDTLEQQTPVIAPSADGGTSAIGADGSFAFSYGPRSFHRHLARLRGAEIVSRVGLLHDLDSPDDLASASKHPRGAWLAGPSTSRIGAW